MKTGIEWIPVSEKLPELESEVLVTVRNKTTGNLSTWSGIMHDKDWEMSSWEVSRVDDYLDTRYTDDFEVTAWAHMPEPCTEGRTEMNEVKLKPCPFCGGEAKMISGYGKYAATCKECDAMTSSTYTASDAAKAWNKRDKRKTYWERFVEDCIAARYASVPPLAANRLCVKWFFGESAEQLDCSHNCEECWDREMP